MTAHTTREHSQARVRAPFTKEEDQQLLKLVGCFGDNAWRIVAAGMGDRTAKQCKDRYFNSLAPNLMNGEWTKEEERLLYEKVNEFGKKWSVIAKYFMNRGPNNLKNHWNRVMLRKQALFAPSVEPSVVQDEVVPFHSDFDEFDNSICFFEEVFEGTF